MKKAFTYSPLTFAILAIGAALTFACASPTETAEQTSSRNVVEAQPTSDVAEPISTVAPSSEAESLITAPPEPPASSTDLGQFALIPESDRQPPSEFQLTTTTDEPFSVANRPGEIIVLYQTEF